MRGILNRTSDASGERGSPICLRHSKKPFGAWTSYFFLDGLETRWHVQCKNWWLIPLALTRECRQKVKAGKS